MRGNFRSVAALCLGTSALTALLLGSLPVSAATTTWTDGTGDWFTVGNWSAGVPGASDTAIISNGGTAQIAAGTATAGTVNITNGSTITLLSGGALNAANTYVGSNGGLLSSGTFVISSASALGTTTFNMNGTLSATTTTTTASNIIFNAGTDSTVSAAAGTTLNLTGNLTFNTSASDGHKIFIGSVTETGTVNVAAPIVTLGANPGPLEVVGGTLMDTLPSGVSNFVNTPLSYALGKLSSVTIDSGATLEIDSAGNGRTSTTDSFIRLFGSGQLVMGGNIPRIVLGDSNFAGQISGSGYVGVGGFQTGAPTATAILTGNNNSAIEFQIGSGSTLQIGNGGTTGSLASGGRVVGWSGFAPGGNAVLKFNRSDDLTFDRFLVGNLVLQQAGSGILTVASNNTNGNVVPFSGSVVVSSGGLSISSDNNLNGNSIALSNATTLYTTASGIYTSPVTVAGDPAFNVASGVTTTWSGQIADGASAGDLRVTGGGTLVLTNASNSYTGGTTISSGTLQLGVNNALPSSGSLQVFGAFDLNGRSQTIGNLLPGSVGGTIQLSGGVLTINQTSSSGFLGNLTGSGTIIFNGPSQLTFSRFSTTTAGIVVNNGSLTVQGLGGGNDLTINGGTFVVPTKTLSLGTLSGTGGILSMNGSFLTFNSNANSTFAGAIVDNASGQITKAGTGALTLTGNASTATSNVVIAGGTLQFGNGGASGGLTNGTITDNGQLVINRSDDVTFGGAISGTGSITKLGADKVTLAGFSYSYTGLTTISAGTLEVWSLSGDVLDNGILIFNTAQPYGGSISGTGSLLMPSNGGSMLTLTGTNTYTGGTSISAGTTLQLGNGGTSGSIAGNVTNDGMFVFKRSDAITFSGVISGAGSLSQSGTGTLILTGANSYSGGTTISSGTLIVGNGATSGSITGNVTDNGALSFNRSDNITFGTIISGSGSVTKAGPGTLILTGANTYIGGTAISGGLLQIGAGGATGSIIGNVTNNGALIFNRSDAVAFAGVISGTGSVAQAGGGTLTLSGTNTYTGATTVSAGALRVNGSIANSSVSVASGATLNGTGTVGATTIQSGGALAPGNSIGTLTVNGKLTFASGAVYNLEVSPINADRVMVSGTASLNGTVDASVASGLYNFGQQFTILNAAGGINGTFASLSGIPAYLKGQLSYDANNAYLTLSPNALAPLLSNATGNQNSVVSAIDAAVAAGNVPPAGFVALYGLSGSALNNALDQISGQAAPNVTNAVGNSFLSFMSMTAAGGSGGGGNFAPGSAYGGADAPHRAQLGAGETRVWGAAYGGHVGLSGDSASGAAGFSSNNVGMIGGADRKITDNILAGVTLGLGRQLFHSGNGSGDSNDFMLGLYGRAEAEAAYVTASFGFGWHQIKTLRVVTVSGTDVLQGKQNADDFGGRIEAGWHLPLDETYSVTPYGAFAGESFESPAYAETVLSGASTFALSYAAQTTTLGRSELGAHLDRRYGLDNGTLTADLRAAWAHQLDDLPFTQASFVNLPGFAFQVAGVRPAPDSALLGLDLDVQNSSGLFFGVHGEGQFGAGTTIVEGLGNFGWRW